MMLNKKEGPLKDSFMDEVDDEVKEAIDTDKNTSERKKIAKLVKELGAIPVIKEIKIPINKVLKEEIDKFNKGRRNEVLRNMLINWIKKCKESKKGVPKIIVSKEMDMSKMDVITFRISVNIIEELQSYYYSGEMSDRKLIIRVIETYFRSNT